MKILGQSLKGCVLYQNTASKSIANNKYYF